MASGNETSSLKIDNAKLLASKTSRQMNKAQPASLAAQQRTPSQQRENA